MSWSFRSFRAPSFRTSSSVLPPDCEAVEPLLPLYADRMASPDEVRQVESHLPVCEGCREGFFWMQATHRALASRPVAVPPANLHSRIAEAIADAPVTLRPARSFTLRPAYAAAASLTVLGGILLGHSLLRSPVLPVPNASAAKHVPVTVASAPPALSKVKNVPLSPPAQAKPRQVVIARNIPADTDRLGRIKPDSGEHALAPKKTAPTNVIAPPDRMANNAPVPAPTPAFAPLHIPVKSPAHLPAAPQNKTASAKVPPAEKRPPAMPESSAIKPNSNPSLVAHNDKEPPPVAVHIDPPTVFVQQPATTKAASFVPDSGGILAVVKARTVAMSTVAIGKTYLTERQISRGGTDAMHALDHENFAYADAIHTPSHLP